MISFYPGPSKVYPQVSQYMQDAMQSGILSMNHRSQPFMDLCRETLANLRLKLDIPADYTIFFASSATECWEMVAQSLLRAGETVYSCVRGAFAQKWADQTRDLCHALQKPIKLTVCAAIPPTVGEAICFLTSSETSNGTWLSNEAIRAAKSPERLLCIDATSSLGGIALDWQAGDCWFASVQKCLGLPAGMAVVVLSPRAVERAYQIHEKQHYNSLVRVLENIQKFQTPYTPNILGIYLLNRVMQQVPPIAEVSRLTYQRAAAWYAYFAQFEEYTVLASPEHRSPTVVCLAATEEKIRFAKQKMLEQNIILGNGYGEGKNTTFRVANFPAITDAEIELFQDKFLEIAKIRV